MEAAMSGGRTTQASPRRWIVAAVVLVIAILLVLAAWRAFWGGPYWPGLSEVSAMTGVTFPKGSRMLHSELWSHLGDSLKAKIELPPDKVKEFLAGLPHPSDGTSLQWIRDDLSNYEPFSPKWWDPSSTNAAQSIGVHYDWKPEDVSPAWRSAQLGGIELLIAFPQGRRPVLYLLWITI
jgi:hypothetical protein